MLFKKIRNLCILFFSVTCSFPSTGVAFLLKKGDEKFSWLPTESAPVEFPIYLIRGELRDTSGNIIAHIPNERDVHNGWGVRGSTHIIGEMNKVIPGRLDVEWFSYIENKFYKGSFDLPRTEIINYFKSGLTESRNGIKDFERLIIGMAPEGFVTVWISSSAETVEVVHFKAEVVDLPWSKVLNNSEVTREQFIESSLERKLGKEVLQNIRKKPELKKIYEKYSKRYNWQPLVSGFSFSSIVIKSFNGDNSYLSLKGPIVPLNTRALPSQIDVEYVQAPNKKLKAVIKFDENEMFSAFEKVSNGTTKSITLTIKIDGNGVLCALTDDTNKIQNLENINVKTYKQ